MMYRCRRCQHRCAVNNHHAKYRETIRYMCRNCTAMKYYIRPSRSPINSIPAQWRTKWVNLYPMPKAILDEIYEDWIFIRNNLYHSRTFWESTSWWVRSGTPMASVHCPMQNMFRTQIKNYKALWPIVKKIQRNELLYLLHPQQLQQILGFKILTICKDLQIICHFIYFSSLGRGKNILNWEKTEFLTI